MIPIENLRTSKWVDVHEDYLRELQRKASLYDQLVASFDLNSYLRDLHRLEANHDAH